MKVLIFSIILSLSLGLFADPKSSMCSQYADVHPDTLTVKMKGSKPFKKIVAAIFGDIPYISLKRHFETGTNVEYHISALFPEGNDSDLLLPTKAISSIIDKARATERYVRMCVSRSHWELAYDVDVLKQLDNVETVVKEKKKEVSIPVVVEPSTLMNVTNESLLKLVNQDMISLEMDDERYFSNIHTFIRVSPRRLAEPAKQDERAALKAAKRAALAEAKLQTQLKKKMGQEVNDAALEDARLAAKIERQVQSENLDFDLKLKEKMMVHEVEVTKKLEQEELSSNKHKNSHIYN